MPVAVPTESDVVDATVTAVLTVTTPVTLVNVFNFLPRFENEWEDLKAFQVDDPEAATDGDVDVVYCTATATPEEEGLATGQVFAFYEVLIRYYNLRKNDPDWKELGDDVVTSIMDVVSKNATIFAIGGQRQLIAPETFTVREKGFTTINDEHGNPQMIYRGDMIARVEARRWT